MLVKLTPDIWFGDKRSVAESRGKIRSIINVAHVIRQPYWSNLESLDWKIWYFKLACPDRVAVNYEYMHAMEGILRFIDEAQKFPLLCHCQLGKHRGPTAAFFAAYTLDGSCRLEYWLAEMDRLVPKFSKFDERKVYRKAVLDYCKNAT